MERLEAALWVSTLSQAKKGDLEAMEMIKAENKARQKYGEPTIEEELLAFLKEEEQKNNNMKNQK